MTKDENFEHLYITKKLKVKHFCLRYFRGYKHQTENIEDVVHEVFINYYRFYDNFRGDCSTDTFLLSIAKNYCLNFIRYQHTKKRQHVGEISLDSEVNNLDGEFVHARGRSSSGDGAMSSRDFLKVVYTKPDPLHQVISNDSIHKIYLAIESLEPMERNVITTMYVDGMNYAEAAHKLEIPVNTVKSRLFRSRIKLINKLKRFKIVQD